MYQILTVNYLSLPTFQIPPHPSPFNNQKQQSEQDNTPVKW